MLTIAGGILIAIAVLFAIYVSWHGLDAAGGILSAMTGPEAWRLIRFDVMVRLLPRNPDIAA
jgi:hypothetical protein